MLNVEKVYEGYKLAKKISTIFGGVWVYKSFLTSTALLLPKINNFFNCEFFHLFFGGKCGDYKLKVFPSTALG